MLFSRTRLVLGAIVAAVLLPPLGLFGAVYGLSAPNLVSSPIDPVGLPVERIAIPSPSGSTLAAWYLPGDAAKGGVVLMHGVGANRSVLIARMRFLNEAGYSILAFDFQAHGESPGKLTTFGRLESDDARAAVAWMRAKAPGKKLGAIGISLGGAAALIGDAPLDVDALVIESVYPDIDHAIGDRLAQVFGPLASAVQPPFMAAGRLVTGLDPRQLRPIDGLERFTAPIFIIGGAEDRHTRIEETREMFAHAHEPKRLWEVPGAAHVDIYNATHGEYRQRILAYFHETL